jgi:hypothetical protein
MKSRYVLVALIGLAQPGMGHAENDAVRQCTSETIDLDAKIASCTTIIQFSSETKEHLAVAYNNRGVAYSRKGQIKQAISDYSVAIRNDPHNAVPFNNRADIYGKANQYQRAIADLDEAIRLKPDYAIALYNRSVDKQKAADHAGADADLTAALKSGLEGASGLPWHFFRDPRRKFFVQFPADVQTPEKTMPGMATYLATANDQMFQVTALDVPNAPAKPDDSYFHKGFTNYAKNHNKQIHRESALTVAGYPAAEAEMTDDVVGAEYLVEIIVIPGARVFIVSTGGRPGHVKSPEARYFRNSFSLFDAPPSISLPPDGRQTSPAPAVQPDARPDFDASMKGNTRPTILESPTPVPFDELIKQHR